MNSSWQHSFKFIYTLQKSSLSTSTHAHHHHHIHHQCRVWFRDYHHQCSQANGFGMGRPELFTPTLGAWQYLRFPICKLQLIGCWIAGQKKDVWSLQLYQASLAPQDLPCAGAGRGHAHLRTRGERLCMCVCARVCSVPANINNTHCIAL